MRASLSDAATRAILSLRVHELHVRHAPHVFTEPTEAERRTEFETLYVRDGRES